MARRPSNRYFEEISQDSAPGRLSKELRKALNLGEDMLPIWIYKMRVLGYPPGWYKNAQITPNLNIVDGEDVLMARASKSSEDGEIEQVRYDETSLIEYPGVNAPMPKTAKDDWLILGMPPFLQPKEKEVKSEENGQKEKTPEASTVEVEVKIELNTSLEEEVSSNKETLEATSMNSSLVKDQVMALLDQTLSTKDDQPDAPPKDVPVSSQESKVEPHDNSLDESSDSLKRKVTVLQNGEHDSYTFKRSKLPSLDKFAAGTTELLYFENLPNTTGAFQNIRGVLEAIRKRNKKE